MTFLHLNLSPYPPERAGAMLVLDILNYYLLFLNHMRGLIRTDESILAIRYFTTKLHPLLIL